VQFEVFYDGDCPLCLREIRLLQRLDRRRERIRFTDITAPDFAAEAQTGLSLEQLMSQIYGRMPDGSLVVGMEVFRQLYGAVGLGFLLAPTGWPVVKPMFDGLYAIFARNRLRLTGRCSTETCAVSPAK